MFVTFEGPEGAGKSTVLRRLADEFREKGETVVETREPGAGEIGGRIREILLHTGAVPARTELMLFLADRAANVETIVRPALAAGSLVFCDRHADSTVVYQGYGRGLDVEQLRAWNAWATGGLTPDLTLLLDLPAEVGLARAKGGDRLDAEPLAFHERVRAGFLTEAEREPDRWRIVDASQPLDTVLAACRRYLMP
jgi:dTMP kinase